MGMWLSGSRHSFCLTVVMCPAALIPSLCRSDSWAASVGLPLVEILYSEAVYDLRYLSLQHCFYISP